MSLIFSVEINITFGFWNESLSCLAGNSSFRPESIMDYLWNACLFVWLFLFRTTGYARATGTCLKNNAYLRNIRLKSF